MPDIVINGVTYPDVPSIILKDSNNNFVSFYPEQPTPRYNISIETAGNQNYCYVLANGSTKYYQANTSASNVTHLVCKASRSNSDPDDTFVKVYKLNGDVIDKSLAEDECTVYLEADVEIYLDYYDDGKGSTYSEIVIQEVNN